MDKITAVSGFTYKGVIYDTIGEAEMARNYDNVVDLAAQIFPDDQHCRNAILFAVRHTQWNDLAAAVATLRNGA